MDAYVNLQPYTSDVQGFFPYIEELRTSVFRFEEDDMRTATNIIQGLMYTYISNNDNITMISMHVRLADFDYHLKELWNMTFISDSILTKTMDYYKKKFMR